MRKVKSLRVTGWIPPGTMINARKPNASEMSDPKAARCGYSVPLSINGDTRVKTKSGTDSVMRLILVNDEAAYPQPEIAVPTLTERTAVSFEGSWLSPVLAYSIFDQLGSTIMRSVGFVSAKAPIVLANAALFSGSMTVWEGDDIPAGLIQLDEDDENDSLIIKGTSAAILQESLPCFGVTDVVAGSSLRKAWQDIMCPPQYVPRVTDPEDDTYWPIARALMTDGATIGTTLSLLVGTKAGLAFRTDPLGDAGFPVFTKLNCQGVFVAADDGGAYDVFSGANPSGTVFLYPDKQPQWRFPYDGVMQIAS